MPTNRPGGGGGNVGRSREGKTGNVEERGSTTSSGIGNRREYLASPLQRQTESNHNYVGFYVTVTSSLLCYGKISVKGRVNCQASKLVG